MELHGNIINEITTQPTTIVGSKKCKSFFKWNFFMSCIWLAPLRRAAPATEAGTTRKTCPGHKWFLVLTKLLLWFNLRLLWLLAEAEAVVSAPPTASTELYCIQGLRNRRCGCVCRPVLPGHPQRAPDYGRSVNPISTKGGRLCPPNNTGTPDFQTFRRPCHYILCIIYELQYNL